MLAVELVSNAANGFVYDFPHAVDDSEGTVRSKRVPWGE